MKSREIAKSAALVTLMMLIFKVIGFLKQAVIAYYFGASLETDAYFIAWGFVTGISEAIVKAVSVALVAIYTEVRVKKGAKEASRLINGVLEIMLPVFVILVLGMFVFSPVVSCVLAPTYDEYKATSLSTYIRMLSPLLLFVYIELVFGAILDSNKSFIIPRLQSFIYSLVTMLCCVFLSQPLGVNTLVLAQFISSAIFTILLIIGINRYHKFFFVQINTIPELKSILVTALPLFVGNSAIQINQIVDKSITSGLGEGAASALTYCQTLEQFVTNIMIVNIGNIMFASFAEYVAKEKTEEIQLTLSRAINLLIVILLGISIVTIFCARDIVSIVYYRGSFTYEAVLMTSSALIGYAISFAGVAVRDLSIKSLYAFKDTKRPVIASIISICVNIFFSILLSRFLGIIGISLATSISVAVGMIINANGIKHYLKQYRYLQHLVTLFRCVPASMVLVFTCILLNIIFHGNIYIKFALASTIGLIMYFIILYVCKIDEVCMLFNRFLKMKEN